MEFSRENIHVGNGCTGSNKTQLLYKVIQLLDYHDRGNRIEEVISERL